MACSVFHCLICGHDWWENFHQPCPICGSFKVTSDWDEVDPEDSWEEEDTE